MALTLHLQNVPAANGLLWVRHGFKIVQRAPLGMVGLFSALMLLNLLTLALPAPLRFVLLAMMPLFSLGFMLATHLVLQGKRPVPSVFIAPLQLTAQRRNTQLALGFSFALLTIGGLLLADQLDGGAFGTALDKFMEAMAQAGQAGQEGKPPADLPVAEPVLLSGFLLRLTWIALISTPYWHAPALVHWGGQGALQALFSSTLGVWRNRGAFSVYMLGWLGVQLAASLGGGMLSAAFALTGLSALLPLLGIIAMYALGSAFYASLYFTFVDCFMFGAPKDVLDSKT